MNKLEGYVSDRRLQTNGGTIGRYGNQYNVLDFSPQDFTVEVIAKSLANQCRYLGNTNGYYSVAQHSVRGAEVFLLMGDITKARQFLFHDAGEAVYGDFSRPFKKILEAECPMFLETMETIDEKLMVYHDCVWPLSPDVKVVDDNLAMEELSTMLATNIHKDYWSPEVAFERFIEMFNKISLMADYEKLGAEHINNHIDDYQI